MRDSEENQENKVPEIIQYFVKGEFQPPTTTYIVPVGEPPLQEGRFTNDAYQHQPHHDQSGQFHSSQSIPSNSLNVEGTKTEAGKEQVSGAPEGASQVQHEEKKEHKPEPPPMQPTWDAQR